MEPFENAWIVSVAVIGLVLMLAVAVGHLLRRRSEEIDWATWSENDRRFAIAGEELGDGPYTVTVDAAGLVVRIETDEQNAVSFGPYTWARAETVVRDGRLVRADFIRE